MEANFSINYNRIPVTCVKVSDINSDFKKYLDEVNINTRGSYVNRLISLEYDFNIENYSMPTIIRHAKEAKSSIEGLGAYFVGIKLQNKDYQDVFNSNGIASYIEIVGKENNLSDRKNPSNSYVNNLENYYIYGNIRSGQRVEHDGNIIIIGSVNNGSEVYAGGNVFVNGSVKGRVASGLKLEKSYIYAKDFNPELISVNGVYENEGLVEYYGKSVFVYSKDSESLEFDIQ